jgi:hypothetical protein
MEIGLRIEKLELKIQKYKRLKIMNWRPKANKRPKGKMDIEEAERDS